MRKATLAAFPSRSPCTERAGGGGTESVDV
jgi:hypothetical protein